MYKNIEEIDVDVKIYIADKFNDFSNKTSFWVEIKKAESTIKVKAKIVPKDCLHKDVVDSHEEFNAKGLNLGDFIISFLSIKSYRRIISMLGLQDFEKFLEIMQDINFLNFIGEGVIPP